ncbi:MULTISPECIES: methylated-DNA--[protein]-cysteine S-methyltransferase [unclassified Sporosarcina]|uniref:methylated-DNA--[protein]-cysteine S-methyltransferase n=1 Tax=unclassified Sporosarcina TaxID=2647733 RepID=UPI001E2ADB8D|nr:MULTISPECIES: methylated-DNA--[protein]-cysteine S-methyltransferase [unclassified Sporosarcina]
MDTLVYWTRFDFGGWSVTLASTEKGLCYMGLAEDSLEHMKDWLKRFGIEGLQEDERKLEVYKSQIKEYLSGRAYDFPMLSLDLKGTPFQLQVWEALQRIPYGEITTYSEIAEQMGKVSSVRAVASAIGKNPVLIIVPCHRVIAKSGRLSGYRDGEEHKRSLLQLEKSSRISERKE